MDSHDFNSFFTTPFPSFPFPTDGSDNDDHNSEQQATPTDQDREVSPLTSQWSSSSQNSSTKDTQQVEYSASQLPPLQSPLLPIESTANSMTPRIQSIQKQKCAKSNSPYFRVPGKPVSDLVAETNEGQGHVSRPPTHQSYSFPYRTPSVQTIRTSQLPIHGGVNRKPSTEDRLARDCSLPPIPCAFSAEQPRFPKKLSELHARLKKLKAQLAVVKNRNQKGVSICYFFNFMTSDITISIIDFFKIKQKEEMKKEVGNMHIRAAAFGNKNNEDKEKLLKCRIFLEAIQEKYEFFCWIVLLLVAFNYFIKCSIFWVKIFQTKLVRSSRFFSNRQKRATKICTVLLTSCGKIGNETINTSARLLLFLWNLLFLIIYSRILY